MKVLITGGGGQLARELVATAPSKVELQSLSRPQCDVTQVDSLRSVFRAFGPEVVINTAAYTAVDKAEAEPKRASDVNTTGAANVGTVSSEFSARTIHVSTDYVFDGHSSIPYPPGAATHPLNVYGTTKLEGEATLQQANANSLIVRTSWLFSASEGTFVSKILSRLNDGRDVKVVEDQVGVPTSAADLATAIWGCVDIPSLHGVYHWVNSGTASWYDFAVRIRERAMAIGLLRGPPSIAAVQSPEYGSAAVRPRYSVLDASALWTALGYPSRHWYEALEDVLRDLPAR